MFTTYLYGQTGSFQQLETKVYKLNNELKFNESQALLLPVIQDDAVSNEDKYQAATLLSYTYKRVFDYKSALKFLDIARTFASETPKKEQYLTAIQSEKAFILFDTHEYKKADRLMSQLAKNGFAYINQENKSKLIMQQGYLLFLSKQYEKAESTYDLAVSLMRTSSPCDLPMIFVKKMQLYNAMNRSDLMTEALRKSSFYADSCKIIKYDIYTYDELLHIYEGRNDLAAILQTKKKLDSLNLVYASNEQIASLHDQKETILLKNKDQQLSQKTSMEKYLTIILIGVVVLAMALLGWLLRYRRGQRQLEADFIRMKSELETYIQMNKSVALSKEVPESGQSAKLSERQQDVLKCMATGMSNKQIADKLFISENTVKYHIKNIYLLLEIKDRKEFLVNVKKPTV
ncbi:hypothetical protein GCM10028825_23280 [Spirosoma agri]